MTQDSSIVYLMVPATLHAYSEITNLFKLLRLRFFISYVVVKLIKTHHVKLYLKCCLYFADLFSIVPSSWLLCIRIHIKFVYHMLTCNAYLVSGGTGLSHALTKNVYSVPDSSTSRTVTSPAMSTWKCVCIVLQLVFMVYVTLELPVPGSSSSCACTLYKSNNTHH